VKLSSSRSRDRRIDTLARTRDELPALRLSCLRRSRQSTPIESGAYGATNSVLADQASACLNIGGCLLRSCCAKRRATDPISKFAHRAWHQRPGTLCEMHDTFVKTTYDTAFPKLPATARLPWRRSSLICRPFKASSRSLSSGTHSKSRAILLLHTRPAAPYALG
jgi:hypothetical protein